ncbi:cytochrome C biogenesis protein [Rhizorhabdus wittichii RW1]|uniref:Cytochrome c-type biogenesis protein n=1 Tax=Rhizorhabdus wittichii (strain DSM 6014 / CCUG 31198 / JCM 15750 / NBRC 105917 / EY 4224 / RW1) TaxID=392499 RepID=A0A9J9LE42_RHIWR|nr:cytochrome C biogenesis protein [Rhizorhabdus wittichii RW1]
MKGLPEILPARSGGRGTIRRMVEGWRRRRLLPKAPPSTGFARGGFLAAALLLAVSAPVFADSLMPAAKYADEQLADPGKEKQAKALMETIRCLVCQGQSIADSNAEMAGDMRALIRTRIEAGEKPEAIRAWLIERYGDWVSFKPPLDGLTWPLYVVPVLFLGLGFWIVSGRLKRRRKG